MKMTFRWYGDDDPVTLDKIRQIPGMTGIVAAIWGITGEAWSEADIIATKNKIEAHRLTFEVVESIPVHEDIKLGKPGRDRLIDNYNTTIRALAKHGVKVICYNFMPVFDWTRTDLARPMPDGSNCLSFDRATMDAVDPSKGFTLPGWDSSYKPEQFRSLMNDYSTVNDEKLWENFEYFLKRIIPVAEEAGVKMAIHPDDPPWPIFGLPRIIKNRDDLNRVLSIVDTPANGLTFCTGSLGADVNNDIVAMVREFAGRKRIHFAHLRNVKAFPNKDFYETAHLSSEGSVDMGAVVKAYYEAGFDGYYRPDHGRMIWGETGKPGYGLYDRALGAVYINGLWEAYNKAGQK